MLENGRRDHLISLCSKYLPEYIDEVIVGIDEGRDTSEQVDLVVK